MEDNPHEIPMVKPPFTRRVIAAQAILLGVLGAMVPIAGYLGWQSNGWAGVQATIGAFLICWLPNAASILVMSFSTDPQQSLTGMLIGMMMRMGIPFGTIVVLLNSKHWLVDAGILPMIVAFYLIALVLETLLSLWIVGASRARVMKAS